MLRPLHSTILLSFILVLISCGKDIEQFTPHQGQVYLDQVFDEVSSPNETLDFQVTAEEDVKLVTENGMLFIIDTQSLLEEGIVASGDQLTLSFWGLTTGMDLLRHQLSTSINDQVFESTIAIRYNLVTSSGNELAIGQSAIQVVVPVIFNDSGESTVYQSNGAIWTDLQSDANLSMGNFEFVVNEATIWSDFGYLLYAATDVWYTISTSAVTNNETELDICVEGDVEIVNSQLYLVNDDLGINLRVGYDSLNEQFCDNWFTKSSESTFTLYALRAEDERNFYISTISEIANTESIELNLSDSMEEIEREALITLLKE